MALEGVELDAPARPEFRVTLLLANPGQVMVHYEVEELGATFPTSLPAPPPQYLARSVIHPKTPRKFFSQGFPLTAPLAPPAIGRVRLRIGYWATLLTVHHLDAVVELRYNAAGSPSGVEWIFVEGPTYT